MTERKLEVIIEILDKFDDTQLPGDIQQCPSKRKSKTPAGTPPAGTPPQKKGKYVTRQSGAHIPDWSKSVNPLEL